MRKGVIVFLAGIGLLCVGIISTSDRFWGKQERSGKLPIDVGDATTVDVRGLEMPKVKFSDTEQPGLRNYAVFSGNPDGMAEKVTVERNGSTLRLATGDMPIYGATLFLPTGIAKVIANSGSFEGNARLRALRIEASGMVNWEGDAGSLTLASMSTSARRKRPSCHDDGECVQSTFSIDGGRIGTLAIQSRSGSIRLGDIDGVGTIELDIGSEAGLSVKHVADLQRLHIQQPDQAPPPR